MLDREELDEWLERGIGALVLVVVLFSALALGGVRTTEFSIITGLTGLAGGLWIARFWLNPSHRFLLHPVIWPVLAFVGYACFRYTQAPVEYVARQDLLHVLVYAVLFLVVVHNLYRQEPTQWVVIVLVSFATLLSFYALVQLATGSEKVLWFTKPQNYVRRGGATFMNPNHLAGFLVTILPLAITQVFIGRWSALARIFFGYGALAIIAGIGVSMSRGGWIAASVAMVTLLVWLLRRRQYRIPALVAAVLIGAGVYSYFKFVDSAQRRITNAASHGVRDSALSRSYLIGPAWKMFKEHPATGVGPGHFDTVFPGFRPPSIQLAPGWVHNEYLQLLVEYGLVGFGLFVVGLGLLGWGIWKTSKFAERGSSDLGFKASNRTAFYLGATIGLVGLLVHCVVEFNLHIPGVALAAVLIAGILASNLRFATDNFWVTPAWWGRILVTLVGLGFIVWATPHAIRGHREGAVLNATALATEVDDALITRQKAALAIEPANPRTAYELGENLRLLSWRGLPGYEDQAREALQWLQRSADLNPFDPYPHLRIAMCHHWLGDADKARQSFERARNLGPNDVTIANLYGWNLILRGQLDQAKVVLLESLRWNDWDNWMGRHYLEMAQRAQQERNAAPAPKN